MARRHGTAGSRSDKELTLELQRAAAVFDATPVGGAPLGGRGPGPPNGDALQARAQHLRKMAALCSMAARRLVELRDQGEPADGAGRVAAEVRAIERFLDRQFHSGPGDVRGAYLASSSGPAGGRGPGDRAEC